MKVLLTGANGFVGSHILDRLRAGGRTVTVLLRPSSDTRFIADHLPDLAVCHGTLEDPASLRNALEGITHVIHCAGATKALRAEDLYRINQRGTRHVVEAVNGVASSVCRLMLISSLAAGRPGTRQAPAREEDPPAPVSVYGCSKLAAEQEVRQHCRVPFTVLRPGGVYGPRDREFLPLFRAVARGILPLFGGGRQELSLVHAPDLAEVVVRLLEMAEACGRTFNVASPEVVTTRDLGLAIAAGLGRDPWRVRLPLGVLKVICGVASARARVTGRPSVLAHGKRWELAAPGWVAEVRSLREVWAGACPTTLKGGVAQTGAWYARAGWL